MYNATVLLLVAALVSACTPQNGEPANGPEPDRAAADTVELRGTVAVVGSAPVNVAVVVRDADGGSARVTGPLTEEIRRLAGAEVEITGRREADPMYGQAIEAAAYSVRSVDGAPVLTGVVEEAADGQLQLRLDDGQLLRLGGTTGQLQAGQKVWIRGPASVQVQSFGVIRP